MHKHARGMTKPTVPTEMAHFACPKPSGVCAGRGCGSGVHAWSSMCSAATNCPHITGCVGASRQRDLLLSVTHQGSDRESWDIVGRSPGGRREKGGGSVDMLFRGWVAGRTSSHSACAGAAAGGSEPECSELSSSPDGELTTIVRAETGTGIDLWCT